ncbi:Crossover junction endodeoxyribonuclease RuvC [Candidatus Magnetobacterium bavaricum]|uniref:Crossover junction endodeoxyribonuclease RuvC n=1 Tax=Candidatus Magnetobacterium bavaricum TaxID=29290 RepID=A0A0F3GQR1_9BACT|nr:Crossover junction endodeoxyribonuclease RuvC [Candidatus Magnetobacterium bavaricum]
MVAEDIEENILLLNIRLKQYGHTVVIARNGLEAVECFKTEKIDVILMDVQMPVMDGLEATRQIRQLETITGGRITIIALTASVMREEKASYIKQGVDAVVEKPIEIDNLLSTIELAVREGIGDDLYSELIVEKEPALVREVSLMNGIDISRGISVWKDAETYKKALIGFSTKYGDAADKISSFIENNDIEGASRMVHSIDGVSGNLSMTDVFKVARELSHSLKERNIDNARAQLGQLKEHLRTVVDSISRIEVAENEPVNNKSELDVVALKGIILRLLESYEGEDSDEVEPILFYARGKLAALQLGHARGVAMLSASIEDVPVLQYSALEVKKAVVGYGRADKEQVIKMTRLILNIKAELTSDSADALALALCHLNTMNIRTDLAGV